MYIHVYVSQVVKSQVFGPLVNRASALPTELLRPDILTDFHTPGYRVTHV